jgi:hypothetical protein
MELEGAATSSTQQQLQSNGKQSHPSEHNPDTKQWCAAGDYAWVLRAAPLVNGAPSSQVPLAPQAEMIRVRRAYRQVKTVYLLLLPAHLCWPAWLACLHRLSEVGWGATYVTPWPLTSA